MGLTWVFLYSDCFCTLLLLANPYIRRTAKLLFWSNIFCLRYIVTKRSLDDIWYRRSSEGPWMICDMKELLKVLEWYFISNISGRSLNDLRSRLSKELSKIFHQKICDTEDLPKVLDGSKISTTFRRSLNDLCNGRLSEGLWWIFDLDYLKILERCLNLKNLRKSLNDPWPQNSFKILERPSIMKNIERSFNDL